MLVAVSASPEGTQRPRLGPRRLLLLAAIGLVAAAAGFYFASDRLPPLDAAALAAARARWRAHGPDTYTMSLVMEGSALARGRYRVTVRARRVQAVTRDGQPVTGDLDAYGVDGLFQLLTQELALAAEPQRGFGAPSGYQAYLNARFDATDGKPLRYRRVVGGSGAWVEWTLEELTSGAESEPR